ncbi:murein L,D-transpeptidase catalytic domain family protein [Chitinophaga sancti]|uniref:murein L,D-transpeptidase catalytic domain family protein n=1 Tax=Chitinophaga sancti TaxID=1004 RepID=UPI002A747B8B|nr:murein L,D-transpeptidase catalytic domain family protein [Chitinophaga sancti]WPQ60872.1 murein L,D-transpeptidase catalytic domain family protein [Chitinophaga sancti]
MKKPVIKKITQYTFAAGVFAVTTFGVLPSTGHKANSNVIAINKSAMSSRAMLYDNLALDSMGLSRTAFNYALQGMEKLEAEGKLANTDLITIVDFSLASSKKRLFVIDLKNGKVLFNTLVSHGRNSGTDVATAFSNSPESFKSSLGFYVTGDTYRGEHGYSLRLEGQEQGINDNAMSRGIVMHSAAYVNEKLAALQGYIGRSLGCPAIPEKVHRKIIEMIKDGTCLFLYSPDKYYMAHSRILESLPADTTIA